MNPARALARWLAPAHAQWQCGLRPFFSAATAVAVLAMLPWGLFVAFGALIVPGAGAVVPVTQWHAQLMLVGMGLAAAAGFVLTAVPEFTSTPAFAPAWTRRLALVWAVGVAASAWPAQRASIAVAAVAWLAFVALLLGLLWPRLWRDPERRQLAFAWGLVAVGACIAGWHVDTLRGVPAGRWLDALLAAYMALMVVAMSRISMRIVNDALDARRAAAPGREFAPYLARPPRRNMAIAAIAAHAVVQWAVPGHHAAGWLALAAAAAMLQLLADWHVGRALLRRWPLLLYAVYAAMAAGYLLMGLGALAGDAAWHSGGRHVLATAAFGIGIYAVFAIAGRTHIGLPLDERRWLPAGAALLVTAATLRALAAAGWAADAAAWLLAGSALAWTAAYALVAWRLVPLWQSPRADGGAGCAGPPAEDETAMHC